MSTPTIFIFGISSCLGANLATHLKDKYRVMGTYFKNELNIPGTLAFECDVRNKTQVKWFLGKFKPDYVFYTAGIPSMDHCEKNPKESDDITQQGLINVIAASESVSAKLFYFSSGYIFSGENIYYSESDNPSPLNHFGNIISNAEFFVQRTSFNYLIFRVCNVFGRCPSFTNENWFEIVESHALNHETLYCDDHIFNGFLDMHSFCKVVEKALKSDISNRLFQLSTTDICSRLNFAEKYEKITGKSIRKVVRNANFPLFEAYRSSKSFQFHLSVKNIEDTFNIKLPSIEECLKNFLNSESGE